jgi:hypothetical protein
MNLENIYIQHIRVLLDTQAHHLLSHLPRYCLLNLHLKMFTVGELRTSKGSKLQTAAPLKLNDFWARALRQFGRLRLSLFLVL